MISIGGGSPGGSIRGQNGYRDALLNISKQDDQNKRTTNNGTRMNNVDNTLVGETLLDEWPDLNNFNHSCKDRVATAGRQGRRAAECNELNLNKNIRHIIDSETSWQAGTAGEEESTEYEDEYEDIPRLFRPLNQLKKRSHRQRDEL